MVDLLKIASVYRQPRHTMGSSMHKSALSRRVDREFAQKRRMERSGIRTDPREVIWQGQKCRGKGKGKGLFRVLCRYTAILWAEIISIIVRSISDREGQP